jgi:hypothetical protein
MTFWNQLEVIFLNDILKPVRGKGHTKDYKIGIYFLSSKLTALRSTGKDWLAWNQDNVSEWSDMSCRRLVSVSYYYHWSVLVRHKADIITISSKCSLFSPWYSWKWLTWRQLWDQISSCSMATLSQVCYSVSFHNQTKIFLLCWYWWNCWNHCIHFFALLLQWVNFWLLLNIKWVIFSLTSSEPFSAISWWEQATFRWNGDDVCFMPD